MKIIRTRNFPAPVPLPARPTFAAGDAAGTREMIVRRSG